MKKIKLLDLYCGAGGCSMGYFLAAKQLNIDIEIIGVDIVNQKNYPFKFIQSDALKYLKQNHKKFNIIHASPPCQIFSRTTANHKLKGKNYDNQLPGLIEIIQKIQIPIIIENVPDSPIRNDIVLRGDIFRLKVLRARKFQIENAFILKPHLPKIIGSVQDGDFCTVAGKGSYISNKKNKQPKFKKSSIIETWKYALGIDWMKTYKELANSIPPDYTKWIALQLFPQLYKPNQIKPVNK